MAHDVNNELDKTNKNDFECEASDQTMHSRKISPFQKQTLVWFGTFLLTMTAGATAGFSAVLIPQLQHAKGKHKLSTEMVSWVAAISSLALLFGNIISGYLMERFGRRTSQIMLSIPFMGGWIIIASANNINFILLGRFITGFCQGWLGPLGPVFVGEISTPAYRGFFLAGLSLAIATGVFVSHLLGTIFHWRTASILCGASPLITCIIIFFAPETPVWLASKNRLDECINSFRWYRGTGPETKAELDKMIEEQTNKQTTKTKLQTLSCNIKKPEFWKPLCIMTTFFIITQLSGVNVICAYTTDIMKELIGNKSHTDIAMLSVDILRCVSLMGACILLRRIGRRPMALFSGVFTSLSLLSLALYLYLVDARVIRHMSPIISLGLMAFYMIVSNIGIVPLPWNMVGELFATETKGIGSGISVMMTSVAFFGTVKTAPWMFNEIGHRGAYLFYGISTLLGTIFLIIFLPETKNKTLLEVEQYFRHSRKSKKPIVNENNKEHETSKNLLSA